jgi:hypothetical protein
MNPETEKYKGADVDIIFDAFRTVRARYASLRNDLNTEWSH